MKHHLGLTESHKRRSPGDEVGFDNYIEIKSKYYLVLFNTVARILSLQDVNIRSVFYLSDNTVALSKSHYHSYLIITSNSV